MKNLLYIFACIYLFSCSNNQSHTLALEDINTTLHRSYGKRFNIIKSAYKYQKIVKDNLYYSFFDLDSAYSASKSRLLETNSMEEAMTIIEDFNSYALELSSANSLKESTINQIPSTNYKQFGMIELATAAKKAIDEMAMMIGGNDVKFDNIKALVVYNNADLSLGESLNGQLYFAAITSHEIPGAVFLVNGDTLTTTGGYADFSYKPTQTGKQSVKFEIKIDDNAPISLSSPLEETVEIFVK